MQEGTADPKARYARALSEAQSYARRQRLGNAESREEFLERHSDLRDLLEPILDLEAKDIDARSDIFSFGVVLYEMVTGQRPFVGDTSASLLASILRDQPPSIAQRHPAVPRALERVIRKCLEKRSDDRWQSARDLKPTLELIDVDAPQA